MNIKRIIREEIDAFEWAGNIEPSNIQTLKHILDGSDYECFSEPSETHTELGRVVILYTAHYYGHPITMFNLGSNIDQWLKVMEDGMDGVVGDEWEDAYHKLYKLLQIHYDILSD